MATKFYKIYDFKLDGTNPQAINTARTIAIEGRRICLVRFQDGYFATDDKCPHAGASLGQGKCDEDEMLICPIHRYKYNPRTGKGSPKQGDYVQTYPVQQKNDGIYVGFEVKWWKIF
jgi:3-phenylpropionate/trans-cinnamate dioxygenase ferredoxin subunit